jgi:hypothetical protein
MATLPFLNIINSTELTENTVFFLHIYWKTFFRCGSIPLF